LPRTTGLLTILLRPSRSWQARPGHQGRATHQPAETDGAGQRRIQQPAVHTIGGVVTLAQALMVIVPDDSRLEIEAMNQSLHRICRRDAAIKADTFNFTLRPVARQVQRLRRRHFPTSRRTSRDKPQGAEASSSEPKGQELNYAARISLDRARMQIEDKTVNLSPGMAVTVEIKTGSRSIISYLLSPLVRYKHESLRER
jgi:hemolysin D